MNTRYTLSPYWLVRADDEGANIVENYKAGLSEKSKELQVEGRDPIYENIEEQACGKRAEIAFCGCMRLHPNHFLNWGGTADPGYDVEFDDYRIDVKSTRSPHANKLIWPVSKNHFFDGVFLNLRNIAENRSFTFGNYNTFNKSY